MPGTRPGMTIKIFGAKAPLRNRLAFVAGYDGLVCRNQLPAILIRRSGLRDQALQFRNAGAAIGAGLEPQADFGGRARARGNRLADRVAADAEAGADHRPRAREPLWRLAGQQHAPLIVGEAEPAANSSFTTSQSPASRAGPRNRQVSIASPANDAARYTPPPKSLYSASSSPATERSHDDQPLRSALSAMR